MVKSFLKRAKFKGVDMGKKQKAKKISKKISNKLLENREQALKEKHSQSKESVSEKNLSEEQMRNEITENLKKHIQDQAAEDKEKNLFSKEKTEPSHLKSKDLSSLNEKLQQALKDNLYLRAEFENFKKRFFEEKRQLVRYGGEFFISSLANEVLDDLDRAVFSAQSDSAQNNEQSFENLKKGLAMIQKKLSQVLDKYGVKIIDPKGQAFDPSYQEALSYIKSSQVPEGHVAETYKKAYKLYDKVIRPAQVVLAKKEDN